MKCRSFCIMEIDIDKVRRVGKHAVTGAAVALALALFTHPLALLAMIGAGVAGVYVYDRRQADKANAGNAGNDGDQHNSTDNKEQK